MERDKECSEANAMLASGATVAVVGLVGALVSGAVCPVCIVAAPALLGIGAVKRLRAASKGRMGPRSP